MNIDFAEYLSAKYPLDERSLNGEVRQALEDALAHRENLACLDIGTGTGAMLRRLIDGQAQGFLSLTGLDINAELLSIARREMKRLLRQKGYRLSIEGARMIAARNFRKIAIDYIHCPLWDFNPARSKRPYDLITAHAFMDMVPLERALMRLADWLGEGGLFYATLNYDGETAFFPPYEDEAFEMQVLAEYDASMEKRHLQGERIGGAKAGRRLHGALEKTGFLIIAYGSSDWNITPYRGHYRDQDEKVLKDLLIMMRQEGTRQPAIDQNELKRWYAERCRLLEENRLGLIVHQLDILARRA